MSKLIEHHIKYKEIHGVDETVFMSRGEHKKLHCRLRKEGKCNISVSSLQKISTKAAQRTQKYKIYLQSRKDKTKESVHKYQAKSEKFKKYKKAYQSSKKYLEWRKEYRQTDKAKATIKRYSTSIKSKQYRKEYTQKALSKWWFSEPLGDGIYIYEQWIYNNITNYFLVVSGFKSNRTKQPKVAEVKL